MKMRITPKGITLFLQFILVIELVVALFRLQWFVAFMFALSIGALCEMFEYSMDCWVGTTMQKPMLNDLSGLTDPWIRGYPQETHPRFLA